jgi:hypothetical protein
VFEKTLRRRVGGLSQTPFLRLKLVGGDSAAKRGRPAEPHNNRAAHRDARSDRKTLQHGD